MIGMPDPRADTATKKSKDWSIKQTDFIIGLATGANDKTLTQKCLDTANGILSPEDYAYVMKTYATGNENVSVEDAINADRLGTLRDVDILTPIKEKYMGEFINSYHNYQVYSLDPTIIFKRNKEIGEKVVKMMFEKLQALLSGDPEKAKSINIEGFIKSAIEEWKDKNVASEQDALELLNALIEAKRKYIDGYFYWWACEEVYSYRRIVGDDVEFEIINPLEYYRVDSGNYFVEDDHAGMRRYTMTIQEVIDKFYNHMEDGLTEDQLKLLKDISTNASGGFGVVTPAIFLENKSAFPDGTVISSNVNVGKQGFVFDVTHVVFKTEIKKGILTYVNPLGEVSEMEVGEDYVLNVEAGDIDIEWTWINQFWENWKFGDNMLKLYLTARPIELQRELISNSSVCKNPYNGISYIHKSSAKKPIPYRIKDNIALYKIYTLLEERWINKFKSFILTPESVVTDSKEMTAGERLQQADVDAMFLFNDTELRDNPNAINYFKEVATTTVINYITVLNQVKQSIKQEAWELANMNDSRFGSGNGPKGKAVTEYDYNQAIKGTVWSLEMFNNFRERDYMANLDHSRAAWIDGKQSSFVDENTKELRTVNVDGMEHLSANIGIFITNSAELNAQADALKQLAFSTGQNNDPVLAAEAITNKNISKLKIAIKTATEARKEFEMQMNTAKEEALNRGKELDMQNDQAQRDHEMEVNERTLTNNYDIAILNSETELAINEAKLEVDRNGNGYIDKEENDMSNPNNSLSRDKGQEIIANQKAAIERLKAGRQAVQQDIKMKQMMKSNTKSK